jgi:hypothetical protein
MDRAKKNHLGGKFFIATNIFNNITFTSKSNVFFKTHSTEGIFTVLRPRAAPCSQPKPSIHFP